MELEVRAEIWRIVRGTGPATAMGERKRLERAVVGGGEGRGRDKCLFVFFCLSIILLYNCD